MRSWKPRWDRLARRIDAMSLRERAMVFGTVVVVLLVIFNSLLLAPLAARNRILLQQLQQDDQKNAVMKSQIRSLIASFNADPDAILRSRLAVLRDQAERSGKTLADIQGSLVQPQRMTALLEDILRRNHGLRLVSLKTLPVTSLIEAETVPSTKNATEPTKVAGPVKPVVPANAVYRHGVELTVAGSYSELVHYLTELETLPWHMFWGKADLAVEAYPKVNLTLRLYTLSLDPAWLTL
jgi:MSHA biogenesis protein MshJ